MTDPSQFPIRDEPHHLMLPPPFGKDHGSALCGAEGITVLFPKNVTCPACRAMQDAVSK